ncbi:MAG: DNA polymerase IV [Desulfarculus sp.]|nr:DNA polymerase IV [Desulfarculus sp.]
MLAHVDMDAFYAAVEVLDRPELAGRPVIVGGGARGVVSAASYEARRFGVRSALPLYLARRLCPQGVFLPVRMDRYRQISRVVMEVLASFTPAIEQVSVDEAYLDLKGAPVLKAGPEAAGRAIKSAVLHVTRLTCSVGLAPVRFLAKIASDRDKPDGLTVVADLEEFLATVELKEVPGVGAKSLERLRAMGLTRLTQVRALGAERLERMWGAFGLRLWELAHGRDSAELRPEREVKSLSHETTFHQDLADREALAAHLLALCEKLGRRLRREGLEGRTVVLKLRHADFRLVTRRASLARPGADTAIIYATALGLLNNYPSPGPFRLIGVGLAGLAPAGQGQPGLFEDRRQARGRALAAAEDAVCERFGQKALTRAAALAKHGDRGHTKDDQD